MSWVRTDDKMPRHPKLWHLSDGAYRLHHHGLSHCAEHATDGFIGDAYIDTLLPCGRARALTGERRMHRARVLANELVAAGVWERMHSGWQIHDYLDYQPSSEEVARERAAAALRQRRQRRRRAGLAPDVTA